MKCNINFLIASKFLAINKCSGSPAWNSHTLPVFEAKLILSIQQACVCISQLNYLMEHNTIQIKKPIYWLMLNGYDTVCHQLKEQVWSGLTKEPEIVHQEYLRERADNTGSTWRSERQQRPKCQYKPNRQSSTMSSRLLSSFLDDFLTSQSQKTMPECYSCIGHITVLSSQLYHLNQFTFCQSSIRD